jgi:hypothetical protein
LPLQLPIDRDGIAISHADGIPFLVVLASGRRRLMALGL